MALRIAIDINDVLRDFTRQFANMYKKIVDPSFDITYENINDVLYKLEPITESDLSYEQVINSTSFPDTELTKKIKKLCVRNEGEEIITNLSDIDIFKIKAKLLKTSPGSVKVVNDNDTTFAVIENQTFTIGKINDKEYVLINDDMKYKKLYIDEVTNIKSIEELKKNMG